MTKRILAVVLGLLLLIGILAGIKFLQIRKMIAQQAGFVPPAETVTVAEVKSADWETLLTAVGSVEAVQGVTVAAELPGKVDRIAFEPGANVSRDTLLVKQDTSSEQALLPGAEAALAKAKRDLQRGETLLADNIISQAEYDTALATWQQASAEVANIRATIAKKHIRAPFGGRLGIRLVNLGEMLEAGQTIVSLQSLDPIFVNFMLPQQHLSQLHTGLKVRLTTDALPDRIIEGRITTINPEVDPATRNIRVQATLDNSDGALRPGMFASVAVVLPSVREVLVIPATAILYAPYSDSVFVVEKKPAEAPGGDGLMVRQQFVRLGEKRGDYISVQAGLAEGEKVVTTGVFKLRNNQAVVVDNALSPDFKLNPTPEEG
ncbi:MAG: efflux RND transporter periplasmic adaptor subunit [Syntrophotaleaceae bacterium]